MQTSRGYDSTAACATRRLDVPEVLVGGHRAGGVQFVFRGRGADDIDPVQGGFGGASASPATRRSWTIAWYCGNDAPGRSGLNYLAGRGVLCDDTCAGLCCPGTRVRTVIVWRFSGIGCDITCKELRSVVR